jgi:serine/threonine protein kinase/predicted Zn-dependent protease
MSERDLFEAALDLPPENRGAYLDGVCAGDVGLRHRLEGLLSKHGRAGSFLEPPALSALATVDESTFGEHPGTRIDDYKLLEQIGEGAFGVVFLAEQEQPVHRKVALKVLKPGMDTRQVVARFEAERQALALMDHPNIARVFDGGTTSGEPGALATGGGRPYFVMELVRGIPITDFCDQHQLTIRDRLALFVTVCHAIQHAHQKGIIHRDLKPSNVLVTLQDGTPLAKVIDFGIAKALGQPLTDKTLFTGFSQLIGTPLYMSPEQAALTSADVDTRSDLYSLGVLFYELLTGTTPLEAHRYREVGFDEVRRIICEEDPPRPSQRISTLGPAVSRLSTQRQKEPRRLSQLCRGELDWIVMKCLEKDPNRRYESASALAADVGRYLHDEPVVAGAPSASYRFRRFVRRKKRALALAGGVLLALAGIAGVLGWAVRDRAAREERIEHERLARQEALDQAVEQTLNGRKPLMAQGRWPEALVLVDRADKLLETAGRTQRPPRLQELRTALAMAERLEDIHRQPLRQSRAILLGASRDEKRDFEEEFFWGREQDARFRAAFREFGIDVAVLAPEQASARIAQSSICPALVQALDEWAGMRKRARGMADPFWKKLIHIAQKADPDTWRNRFRAALLRRDRPALEQLADDMPVQQAPPATSYLLGQVLKELGSLQKAVTVLRAAHRLHPDDFWLNDALGSISKQAFQPPHDDDALRYYTAALALRPQSPYTHIVVAELLQRKGRIDEALAEFSRAIDLDRGKAYVWRRRATAYFDLYQYDKAIADCNEVLKRYPHDANDWNSRGAAYNLSHQFDKALADLNRGLKMDPKQAVFWHNRGWAYNELHQHQRAIADLTKAVTLAPSYSLSWAERGYAYTQLRQYPQAFADFNRAIQVNPRNVNAWSMRAQFFKQVHRYDLALANYNRAFRLAPTPVIKNNVAWLLATCPDARLRDPKRAVDLAASAVKTLPINADLWTTLGVARYTVGDWKGAALALKEALKRFKGSRRFERGLGRALLYLAMAQRQLGQVCEAGQTYDRARRWLESNRKIVQETPWLADELTRFQTQARELLGH